ncbi:MAG: PilZ domain-containing protein [Planctomycetota bacterium]|nr:PilZ domain-containing protein [Planctomycetota bacterium]
MAEASNNRKHPRVPIAKEAPKIKLHMVSKAGQSDTRMVRATDLSKTGMSFNDPTPVAVGLTVTILLTHASKPQRVIGKVTNCREVPEGGYLIGVKFVSITPYSTDSPPGELTDNPLVDRLQITL